MEMYWQFVDSQAGPCRQNLCQCVVLGAHCCRWFERSKKPSQGRGHHIARKPAQWHGDTMPAIYRALRARKKCEEWSSWDPTEVWQCMSQWAKWMYWKLAQHQSLDTCSPAKGPWWSMQLMVFFSFVSLHLLDLFLAFKSQPSRRARQLWVLDTALRCARPPAAVLDHRSYTQHAVVWTKLLRLQGRNKE